MSSDQSGVASTSEETEHDNKKHWLWKFEEWSSVDLTRLKFGGVEITIDSDYPHRIWAQEIGATTVNQISDSTKNIDELLSVFAQTMNWIEPWWTSDIEWLDATYPGDWEGYSEVGNIVIISTNLTIEISESYRGKLKGKVWLTDPPDNILYQGAYELEDWPMDKLSEFVQHLRYIGFVLWGREDV